MATQASLELVQELYVAYYGRPADTAGQEYWAERVDAEGEGAILNAFGNSEEFQEAFGDLSNEELVNNLYQQLFSRDAEEEGQSYWVGVLESGEKSLAEIAVTIKNAAQNDDKTVLEAKVAAATEYTDANGGETYDVEAAKAAVAEAGSDIADAAELTEDLATLLELDELPAEYTVDTGSAVINNAATVADATAALDIIAGAANADELSVEDLYVWKIEDSASNIVAAIESGAVTGADEVRAAFEAGDQLTVEQAEALATLDNLVGDLPPVDQDGAVLSGLQKLETAQTDESNFLEANADNELLEDQGLGENPTNAEVADAIRQADVEADEDVVAKENAVLGAEADLANARTVEFGSYSNAANNDGISTDADVTGTSNTQVVGALDSVSATTRMSDANLAAAATEAQANVTADERVYNASTGATVAASAADLVDVYEVTGTDATDSGLSDGALITDSFAGVAQVTAYDFSSGTAAFKLTVNGNEYTGATGADLATAIQAGEEISAGFATDKLTLTADVKGVAFTTSGAAATGATPSEVTADAVAAFDTSDFIANNEPVGVVTTASENSGEPVSNDVVTDDTATAAELQAAVAATANEVTSARAATSDADLLSGINAAINGYLGAGGDNVEPAIGESLLDLRLDITTALDVAEGETVELTQDNGAFNTTPYSSDTVLKALAGNSSATVNENGIATVDATDAPTSGEGTWVKGEETSTPGTFTFTYEPSAEEQALVNAMKGVEGRVTLLDNQANAEDAFDASVTGGVFNTVEALVAERDALEDAIDTANGELSAAQGTAEDTQALVDQLDVLEQAVTDAETHLTEELGVNLVDFDETTNVATATSQDDVILLSAAEDGDSIANFGGVGEDRLYVGTEFTLENVETGVDVAGSAQGDASVLEVFVQQTAGGNTELFFEEETFGGSATQGNELTQVTLTGVTGEVSISEDGFLTIA